MSKQPGPPAGAFTVDVEDWYHILDTDRVPPIEGWDALECRVDRGLGTLLDLLGRTGTPATLFWLGWLAERHPEWVRRCHRAGHEVASHGYAHLLAYRVGPDAFRADVERAKAVLEDIVGAPVLGFRAPGFGIKPEAAWAFEVIRAAGHTYDSSVFPARRGHGGMADAPVHPYRIDTPAGPLVEIPNSVVTIAGRRVSLFGGGYLRAAPPPLIRWGVRRLARRGQPLIVYIHPRELDPGQPRLRLPWRRRLKYYLNLRGTLPKLRELCRLARFTTMGELARQVAGPRVPEAAAVAGPHADD